MVGTNEFMFADDIITDRKADLLVEVESLRRRLSKMEKKI